MESVVTNYQPPISWSEDETGYPLSPLSPSHLQPNPSLPESKRDKKRREIGDRLTFLNADFLHSREENFRSTLQKLQAELTALHDGGHQEFLDQVEMLEDARDKELVQIEAGRGYALLRAEREYQDEMRRAEEEYVAQKRGAKDALLKDLESKRIRLLYDRDLLEGDANSLMAVASTLSVPLSPNSSHIVDRRKLRTHISRRHHGNGLGISAHDDIFSNKRSSSKKPGNAGGVATPLVGAGGYESEQPITTVGPGGRIRREDVRDKVMNTFKVSEETNLKDLVEIRKAIGGNKSVKGNKKK